MISYSRYFERIYVLWFTHINYLYLCTAQCYSSFYFYSAFYINLSPFFHYALLSEQTAEKKDHFIFENSIIGMCMRTRQPNTQKQVKVESKIINRIIKMCIQSNSFLFYIFSSFRSIVFFSLFLARCIHLDVHLEFLKK